MDLWLFSHFFPWSTPSLCLFLSLPALSFSLSLFFSCFLLAFPLSLSLSSSLVSPLLFSFSFFSKSAWLEQPLPTMSLQPCAYPHASIAIDQASLGKWHHSHYREGKRSLQSFGLTWSFLVINHRLATWDHTASTWGLLLVSTSRPSRSPAINCYR